MFVLVFSYYVQMFVSELEEGHANQSNHANQLFVSELEDMERRLHNNTIILDYAP